VGRIVMLSVAVLMTVGRTGIAFSNWTNNYGFYYDPSSDSLSVALTSTDIASASFGFSPMPDGGFGPPAASFNNSYGLSAVIQTHTALKFKDRWPFDYWTGGHPHRRQNDAQRRRRVRSLWALMGL
jgi:hypothetical protein